MNDSSNVMLQALDLHCGYGANAVLRGLELEVRGGEVYALLGGNGAGKSTLLNAFLGFVKPTRGQVRVAGIDVQADLRAARTRLAYVPENVVLYEQLSARENLAYLLALSTDRLDDAVIETSLDTVGLERSAWNRRLANFSKGMRQRVAIAFALARRAPVLLLDEPSSGLDPKAIDELHRLVLRLRDRGIAVLMTTHDLFAAAECASRVGFLKAGVLSEEVRSADGSRAEVRHLQEKYLASAVRP
jgi:ABC-2 type transport system ATP-binding protein